MCVSFHRAPPASEPDRELLAMLAEHRVLVEPQVQALLGVGPAAARRRLRRLREAGLIHRGPVFHGHPQAIQITRDGLAAIESPFAEPRLRLDGYRHDVGLGWLWVAAHDGAFGVAEAVITERAMRSHDAARERGERPLGAGLGLPGPRGGEQLHYPDLVLELRSGHRVAVELELTGKPAGRLDRIMLAYASDGRFDAVLYLVPPGQLGARIEAAARRAGCRQLVHVHRLASERIAGAPDPPGRRSQSRGPSRRQQSAAAAGGAREVGGR